MIPPCLKVRLGALRQEDPPGGLKVGAGLIEVGGGAAGAFAGPAAGIEPAAPLPSRRSARIADALRDRADNHVAVMDAPALLRDVGIAAAGQAGHGPIIPPIRPKVKPSRERRTGAIGRRLHQARRGPAPCRRRAREEVLLRVALKAPQLGATVLPWLPVRWCARQRNIAWQVDRSGYERGVRRPACLPDDPCREAPMGHISGHIG